MDSVSQEYPLVRVEGKETGLLTDTWSVQLLTLRAKEIFFLLLQDLHVLGHTEGSWCSNAPQCFRVSFFSAKVFLCSV